MVVIHAWREDYSGFWIILGKIRIPFDLRISPWEELLRALKENDKADIKSKAGNWLRFWDALGMAATTARRFNVYYGL